MSDEMRVVLANPTETILREIGDKSMKRKDVAMTYAMCLSMPGETPDFPRINRAIVDRWSLAALRWIKQEAWRLVEQKRAGTHPGGRGA